MIIKPQNLNIVFDLRIANFLVSQIVISIIDTTTFIGDILVLLFVMYKQRAIAFTLKNPVQYHHKTFCSFIAIYLAVIVGINPSGFCFCNRFSNLFKFRVCHLFSAIYLILWHIKEKSRWDINNFREYNHGKV